jgi:hypothetical protein
MRASNVEPETHAQTSVRVRHVRLSDLRRENQSVMPRQHLWITRATKLSTTFSRPLS